MADKRSPIDQKIEEMHGLTESQYILWKIVLNNARLSMFFGYLRIQHS